MHLTLAHAQCRDARLAGEARHLSVRRPPFARDPTSWPASAVTSSVVLLLVSGCGSPFLTAGKTYLANGNLPIAIEVFDAGLAQEPGNDELRDALILAQQTYSYELHQDVERLAESGRALRALRQVVEMEDVARRARALSLPGEDPTALETRREELVRDAITRLDRSLDERAGRGAAVKSDLATCRQLLALRQNDESIQRTCERLRSGFELVAVLQTRPGSAPEASAVLPAIQQLLIDRNPELLELVEESAGAHNAKMELYVGRPQPHDTGWVMVARDAYHTWVPKRDKKGRQIEETVVEQPSKKEIEDAKRDKKPPPKPKRKKKKVYELVEGEYRVYRASRSVRIPYAVVIEDLRRKTIPVWFGGTAEERSTSAYYEFSGNKKARKSPPVPAEGRGSAPRLLDMRVLEARALAKVPRQVVDTTLGRIE